MEFTLTPSTRSNKKWMIIYHHRKIHFGDSRYQDFTTHRDSRRRDAYIIRHRKNEYWNDLSSPGCWSRWLLWEKPSLLDAVRAMEKRFGVTIIMILFW